MVACVSREAGSTGERDCIRAQETGDDGEVLYPQAGTVVSLVHTHAETKKAG